MKLSGDLSLAQGYTSRSQQARLITEGWIKRYGYCLRCDSNMLLPTAANSRTRDFSCSKCEHPYELKSKRGSFTNQVLDGAYSAMINTIRAGKTPTFLLMEYTPEWSVAGLRAIHHSLISEEVIKPRKPLSVTAKRAGWIGCSIDVSHIALDAQIAIIEKGIARPRKVSRGAFARLESLSKLTSLDRSWAGSMLYVLRKVPNRSFTLRQVYGFVPELQAIYPGNKHVKPKIRQQLQLLRDAGIIRFLGAGEYEFV